VVYKRGGILGVSTPTGFFAIEICQSPKVIVKLISVSPEIRFILGPAPII